jgi:hypothetical protein
MGVNPGRLLVSVLHGEGRSHPEIIMGQITFAKVGGPPHSWRTIHVINRTTSLEVRDVVEVDTVEGYVIRLRRDVRGKLVPNTIGDGPAQERITGDFEIKAGDDAWPT